MLTFIAIFLIINLQTAGFVDVYASILIPLPIIFYHVKYGMKATIILSISSLILSLILGSTATIMTPFYLFTGLLIGIVYGYGVRKDKDNGWLIFFTFLITAISISIEMYVLAGIVGYDIIAEANEIISILKDMEGIIVPINIEALVLSAFPLLILFTSFIQGVVVHLLSILLLRRLKIKTRKMTDLIKYKLPNWLGIISLMFIFAGVFIKPETMLETQWLALFSVIGQVILVVDAYVLIVLIARRYRIRWLPMFSILSLIMLPSFGIYALIGIGLLDALTDFRVRVLKIVKS